MWCECRKRNLFVVFLFFSRRRGHTRLRTVTGVQTCALPICTGWYVHPIDLESAVVDAPYQVTPAEQIGRASCRERGEISVGAGSLKKNNTRGRSTLCPLCVQIGALAPVCFTRLAS